ncbi:hypothetical protein EDEG_02494 [Edhazardia aedis USNM 41457]|uniref:Uncharacterized protein n=1 Tax=Edhazardia aedis (strain USNM 41457) TaxID=1003232 RepID=J8ZTZ7_EDHAE|nr:hypothetical protein EDEG_02494 [Edhazardia aedis USNM 41457]|eukprot:EJW03123.1 hypothetical protein EDEG_02494 [Edhazardia aedis USNM 41457]
MFSITLHFVLFYCTNLIQDFVNPAHTETAYNVNPKMFASLNANYHLDSVDDSLIQEAISSSETRIKNIETALNQTETPEKIFLRDYIAPPYKSTKYFIDSNEFDPKIFSSRNSYELEIFNEKSRIQIKNRIRSSMEKFLCYRYSPLYLYYMSAFENKETSTDKVQQVQENFKKYVDYLIDKKYKKEDWELEKYDHAYHVNCENPLNIKRININSPLKKHCISQTLNAENAEVGVSYDDCRSLLQNSEDLKSKHNINFSSCFKDFKNLSDEEKKKVFNDFFNCREGEPLLYNIDEYTKVAINLMKANEYTLGFYADEIENLQQSVAAAAENSKTFQSGGEQDNSASVSTVEENIGHVVSDETGYKQENPDKSLNAADEDVSFQSEQNPSATNTANSVNNMSEFEDDSMGLYLRISRNRRHTTNKESTKGKNDNKFRFRKNLS